MPANRQAGKFVDPSEPLVAVHVLTVLGGGACSASELIERLKNQGVRFRDIDVYVALSRLEVDRLVKSSRRPWSLRRRQREREYELTDTGRAYLTEPNPGRHPHPQMDIRVHRRRIPQDRGSGGR
jgi:DNA-binding PadR family transcriptional regulator